MDARIKIILPLIVVSGAALAQDAGMLRCRGIAEPVARLACYDALASPARATEEFGREERTAAPTVESIQSHIPGEFLGWQPKSQIRLANGQVWQVTDGSSGGYRLVDAKVKLQRGALGSYFLELEGQNRSIRVRRVQ